MPYPKQLKIKVSSLLLFLGIVHYTNGQTANVKEAELLAVLRHKDSLVDAVLSDMPGYRFQLAMSLKKNETITNTIQLGQAQYFYPASLVKLPLALMTLEKIKRLNLDLNHSIQLGAYAPCKYDGFVKLGQQQTITFRQLLEELLVVSDNNHYNTLFHFITPKEINKALKEKGFTDSYIYKSFEGCELDQQLHCGEILVKNTENKVVFRQEASSLDTNLMMQSFPYSEKRLVGSKRYENRKIIKEPIDFNYTNDLSLLDIHILIESLFENDKVVELWDILPKHKEFLLTCMQKFPREMIQSYHPNYKEIEDNKFKYFRIGESPIDSNNKRTFSKIAYSYGFTTETAFIPYNEKEGLFLSMTIYTNENGILNDGKYEYDEIARPVFSRIANLLYTYFRP